ncbi:hypothetical protein EV356DRAFT_487266 [Viridothelium virens]|uniref:MARVEL domain-containing protein n=1 Tax=Viridothelium virens TaxID=1048519 RepID=A0A6A6H5L3_VIRVR|nr:hypothetical protein EV356DRAFT_487266 [Viridothelium virens]
MPSVAGGALRLFQTFLYAIIFCCSAIILGVYSYFLSVLSDRNLPIATWKKAVEGLSGAATLYMIFAVLLTCFLGGVSFFAFLAVVLDVLFIAAMVAIAVMTRDGAHSCTGVVNTPLGNGPSNSKDPGYGQGGFGFGKGQNLTYAPNLHLACRLNTVSFAVSIIAAFLFVVTALMQVALVRHHRREKRYGPSPANNYTSGSGRRRFWRRKPKSDPKDSELGTTGAGVPPTDIRPSHDTAYTGSTMAAPGAITTSSPYKPEVAHHGYHTQPTGTAVNPYGYDNTRTTGTNF